jgi:hypothetical protein
MPDSAVSEREQKVLRIIETARAKRPRFKDETVTMAHGAGGKATQTLIEGLLVPALAREGETLDGQLRRTADQLPGRLDRRARRKRHGE